MTPSPRRQVRQEHLPLILLPKLVHLSRIRPMAQEQVRIPKGHIDSGAKILAVMHVASEK